MAGFVRAALPLRRLPCHTRTIGANRLCRLYQNTTQKPRRRNPPRLVSFHPTRATASTTPPPALLDGVRRTASSPDRQLSVEAYTPPRPTKAASLVPHCLYIHLYAQPTMSQQPSTPVKVPSSAASYTPATVDADLRSQINTVLLRDGHINKYETSIPSLPSRGGTSHRVSLHRY